SVTREFYAALGKEVEILRTEENKFYITEKKDWRKLYLAKLLDWSQDLKNLLTKNVEIEQTTDMETNLLSENKPFSAMSFDKTVSGWKEAKKILDDLKIDMSIMSIIEAKDFMYIVRKYEVKKMSYALNSSYMTLSAKPAKP